MAVETDPSAVDPDREVLAAIAAGDGDALARLVERHQRRLLGLCERLLGDAEAARDAVQEVFLKVYLKAGSYTPRGQVFTWLYRIAVNHCLNRLRRDQIVRFLRLVPDTGDAEAPEFDPPDPGAGPEADALTRERWRATRSALAALPPSQRTVLVLARFEGLPQRRIAELLGITEGAVESRLVRAMRRLDAALAGLAADTGVAPRPDAPQDRDEPRVSPARSAR